MAQKRKRKSRGVRDYLHEDARRKNNPPAGMVPHELVGGRAIECHTGKLRIYPQPTCHEPRLAMLSNPPATGTSENAQRSSGEEQ